MRLNYKKLYKWYNIHTILVLLHSMHTNTAVKSMSDISSDLQIGLVLNTTNLISIISVFNSQNVMFSTF